MAESERVPISYLDSCTVKSLTLEPGVYIGRDAGGLEPASVLPCYTLATHHSWETAMGVMAARSAAGILSTDWLCGEQAEPYSTGSRTITDSHSIVIWPSTMSL